jgi:predicted Zn-dependent protease
MAICKISANQNGELEFSEEEQSEWKHKWDKQVVYYSLQKDSEDITGRSLETKAVNIAFSTWNFEIPLKLKSVKKNQTPDIYINFVKSDNDEHLKKGVLGYAYYPKTSKQGKIVFNEDYLWSLDGKPVNAHKANPTQYPFSTKTKLKTYNMVHVLIHEIGHSLGLKHDVNNPASVMWWQYNGQLHLNRYDIERITDKYGTRRWNPRKYRAVKRWLTRRKNGL